MSHVSDKPATGLLDDLELYTRIYRQMLLIRGFEDLVQSLFLAGEVYGTTHLYSGQEAVATGFASILEDRDRIAATYRGHGHALAMGVDPQALLDEMLGRESGVNGGRAGSMNVNSPENRMIGSFGIVGGSIAAATGAALGLKKTTGGVAVAYFGDGTMNQGYVFECLNFCKVLELPLVLVCENNGYGEYTPFRSVTAGEIRARAEVMERAGRDDRRHERLDRARGRRARGRACPRGKRARLRRGAHVPLRRPLAQRPRRVPARRRARAVEGRATRSSSSARSSKRRASPRPRSTRSSRTMSDELERMRESGLAAPFPTELTSARVQGLSLVAHELTMPKLSDSMADAVILRWLKSPGEAFERGEGLIEVETDKATVVYEAESDGHARIDPRSGRRAPSPWASRSRPLGERRRRRRRPSRRRPVQREPTSAQPASVRRRVRLRRRRRARGVRTRRRSRGGPLSSSACRSTASTAPGPAAGSRPRT